jgi:very-short-patch-repair endonuclease
MPNDPKNLPMFQNASPQAFEKARALRKGSTLAENKMWHQLRSRQVLGKKFRRQHPFEEFILDFYCDELKLVIEVDGGYHASKEQAEYDQNRTDFLKQFGLKILRFTNQEVEFRMMDVLKSIALTIENKNISNE